MLESGGPPLWLIVSGGLAMVVTAVAVLARLDRARLVVAVMLFASSIAVIKDWRGRPQSTWIMPIQESRSWIVLAAGVLLWIAATGNMRRISLRHIAAPAALMLAAALYAGLLQFVHAGSTTAVQTIGFALATIAPLALVAPALMADCDGRARMIRVIIAANLVWLGVLVVQLIVNPDAVTQGRSARLYGLTGNPQHTGVMMAFFALIALWSALNGATRRAFVLSSLLLAVNLLMLLWTGSRTAGGMFVVGSMVILRHRLGRAILLLPLAGLLLYALLTIAGGDIAMHSERLLSTANTRATSWRGLLDSASRNPLFGVGEVETLSSENSYLYAASAYGVFMVALFVLVAITSARIGFRLFWLRSRLADHDLPYVDLVLAGLAMYFAGSILEGYMMSRVSVPLVMLILFSSLGVEISRAAHREPLFDEIEPYEQDLMESTPWPDDDAGSAWGAITPSQY